MKNLLLHEKLTIAALDDEQKKLYVCFVKALITMGRDTKKIYKIRPEISYSEVPKLILLSKSDEYITITFNVEANSWVLHQGDFQSKFNPTAITGVLMFLENFNDGIVMKAIELFNGEFEQLLINSQPSK